MVENPFEIISDIIINAGIANGFLLAILFRMLNSHRSKFLLSLLLILLSLIVLRIHYIYPYLHKNFEAPFFISGPFIFLLAPFLFFYLRSISNPGSTVSKKDWAHFIPFVAYLLLFIPPFILGFDSTYAFYLRNLIGTPWIFLVVQLIYYLVQTHRVVNAYQKEIVEKFSNVEGLDVSWLRYILWIFVAILAFIVIGMPSLVHGINVGISNTISSMFFSVVLFFIAYKGIQQKIPVNIGGNGGYAKNSSEETINRLKDKLLNHMERHKPFLNPELNLVDLAKQLEMNRNLLSQVINSGIGDNFYHFVNTYRVEEVKKLIKEDINRQYTILSLANSAGFNSKSSFNYIFKKITGLTPSQYREGQL